MGVDMMSEKSPRYNDIRLLAAGIYGSLSMIEHCLKIGDYLEVNESIKRAKDKCYECLEITRKTSG